MGPGLTFGAVLCIACATPLSSTRSLYSTQQSWTRGHGHVPRACEHAPYQHNSPAWPLPEPPQSAPTKTITLTRATTRRSDAERLACRVTITKLEEHNASLAQQLADVRKELEVAAAAHAAAHREFEALAAARATQEVDMMRVRHDFETDEILVVSLRQQVRDLEAQLAQLKAFQRDQALALAREVGEKELALGKVKGLGGELEFERARVRELEGQLGETQAKLAETAAALAAKSREYDELAALHEREMAAAKAEIEGLTAEAKQLANRLTDTDTKLMVKERALKEAENELYSLREMLASVATTMHGQGADGVPRQDDKGWGVPGPLGAPQRTIMIASRQLGGLWERLEAMRKENDTLTERLAGEMVMQQKLQVCVCARGLCGWVLWVRCGRLVVVWGLSCARWEGGQEVWVSHMDLGAAR